MYYTVHRAAAKKEKDGETFMWSGPIYATADLCYLFFWPHLNGSKLNLALMTQRTKSVLGRLCLCVGELKSKRAGTGRENIFFVFVT